jgi:hypothetical protein
MIRAYHHHHLLGGDPLLRLCGRQLCLPDRKRGLPDGNPANAIAYIYAVGTLVGGALAPYIFGLLIQTQSAQNVFFGYLVGSFLMILGGLTELFFGVDSERKSLEQVAAP